MTAHNSAAQTVHLKKKKETKKRATSVRASVLASKSLRQGWYTVCCAVMHHQVAGVHITFHFKRIHSALSRALWVMSRIIWPYITSRIKPSLGRAYFLWLISLIVLVICPAPDMTIYLTLGQWWCWWWQAAGVQITCLSGGWGQSVWQFQFHGSGSHESVISNPCHRHHHPRGKMHVPLHSINSYCIYTYTPPLDMDWNWMSLYKEYSVNPSY